MKILLQFFIFLLSAFLLISSVFMLVSYLDSRSSFTKALFSREKIDSAGTCFISIDKEFSVYAVTEGEDQKLVLFRNGVATTVHAYSSLFDSRMAVVDYLMWNYYTYHERIEQKKYYLLKCN